MDRTGAPSGADEAPPNVARMYNYYLGGKDNFAADRAAAEQVISVLPEVRFMARMNRTFLRRAVRTLAADAGIRQFLDIGSGLPTQGNVHEIAHSVAPDSRVVYVDHDPVVVAHGRGLAVSSDRVAVANGDLRRPEGILTDPAVRSLIDFDRPVAILLVSLLHFIPDTDQPAALVARLRAAAAPGSHLVLSHGTAEARPDAADTVVKVYQNATSPIVSRTRAEIMRFFGGMELLDPGLVWLSEWGADGSEDPGDPSRSVNLAGVARKP